MKKAIWQLLVVAGTAILTSCGYFVPTTLTTTSNGITYEFPFQKAAPAASHDSMSSTQAQSGATHVTHTEFTFIGETLTIKELDGNLTINGKDYSTVKTGDKVRIDKAGNVSVNGTPRPPK